MKVDICFFLPEMDDSLVIMVVLVNGGGGGGRDGMYKFTLERMGIMLPRIESCINESRFSQRSERADHY